MDNHVSQNERNVALYRNWALVLFLLVATFSVWRISAAYADRVDPTSFRSFMVSGEAKTSTAPDVAEFTFSVLTEGGKDLAALQTQNTNSMNSALAYVKQNGVDEKDVKTSQYNVSPRYEYSSCTGGGTCPPPQIAGYTVSQSATVKARDFSKVGDLLAGVVKNGANSVSELRFTLDDPTESAARAREEAMGKAREKAEAIAKSGKFRLGRLLSIDESGGVSTPMPYYFGRGGVDNMALEKAAPSIAPGSEETTVTVTLRYEIKD
jgi:uncharacterized protein YggE